MSVLLKPPHSRQSHSWQPQSRHTASSWQLTLQQAHISCPCGKPVLQSMFSPHITIQQPNAWQPYLVPQPCSACRLELTRLYHLQVRSVPVTTRQIELSALNVREAKVQELKSVEASLRLDAIASAGYRTSRSKIVDLVKAGDLRCLLRRLHACAVHEFVNITCDQATCVLAQQCCQVTPVVQVVAATSPSSTQALIRSWWDFITIMLPC